MFNRYFQDELTYLRELGREFAEAYPALAPMLADRGGDPDVERLLEGVAFLTGRIRQKLDDEIPEVIHSIASLLFPHLLRPLPSATIIELSSAALRESLVVPEGAEFGSVEVDGTTCRFRANTATRLSPWVIDDVRLEMLSGQKQQLRIEMRVMGGLPLGDVASESTRFHLAGDIRGALDLLMWIHERTDDVVLIEPKIGGKEREISLGKNVLAQVGFKDEEALLPLGLTTFPGFRLLQEYYLLPQKFAFIDIRNLVRAQEFAPAIERFDVAIRFKSPLPTIQNLDRHSVKLHCVPVANVFPTTAEPIRLTPLREQFLVRPAGLSPANGEVYAVTNVETIPRGTSQRIHIPSFYEFTHTGSGGDSTRIFHTTHLMPGTVGDGSDMTISFGTPGNAGIPPDTDVVSLDIWATNRRLASGLRAGEISVRTPNSPAVTTFKNITAATAYVPTPLGRELHWRVVAHTAMGLRSLADPSVLRGVLDVYNFHALTDRQAARSNELRTAAIRDVRVTPTERLFRGAPVRGVNIDVDADETGFTGEGDLFLFSAVLDQFFANYVSLNSFSRTTVTGVGSKIQFSWPARSGNTNLL